MDQEENKNLGLAGGLAKMFIHSPLSPLLFAAMLFMGVVGLFLTPRQEDPQISVPLIDIFVQYPGASAEQVSSLAVEPLERIMSEIKGVKHVYSTSMRGQGMVVVQFIVGEKLGPSIVKVHDKIQSNLDMMPPGVKMPLVKPKGIDDVSVVNLTLWSNTENDGVLRRLALDVTQQLKTIEDTGYSFVAGGRKEQARIEILPEKISGYGLSLEQVANMVQAANTMQNIGTGVEVGDSYVSVVSGNWVKDENDLKNIIVGVSQQGMPIYLRNIANVIKGPEIPRHIVSYYTGRCYEYLETGDHCIADAEKTKIADAASAVTIAIAKKEGSNGISVAEKIIEKARALQGDLIPANVHLEVTRNYGQTAKEKVDELIFKLFKATGIVTILVLYFLGLRPAIVVTLIIPVVILFTVFSAFILGYTIDRVSLFALIFSIGILVDDAIVVIENMYRRWLLKGEMDTETAIDSVREVGNPTILATFTVIAALMPMGFVSGMMGPYMEPIPALGSVAMLFSLFAAFVFTPWFAMRLKPSMAHLLKEEKKEHAFNERMEKRFRWLLIPMLENKVLGYGFIVFLFIAFFASCSLFYFEKVKVKMLPLDNKPEFSVVIDMQEGTALPVTANFVRQIAEQLRDTIPEITAMQSYVGTARPFDFNGMVRHYYLRDKPWQAEIQIQLTGKSHRSVKSHELAVQARKLITEIIQNRNDVKVTIVEMPPGPPVLQAIVAEVYGENEQARHDLAATVTQLFEESPIIKDVDNYMYELEDAGSKDFKKTYYWHFEVNTEKASRLGISVDTINRNLSMALGGYKLGDLKTGRVLEPVELIIQTPLEVRSQINTRLLELPIPTMGGQSIVSLSELGRFKKVREDSYIHHKNLRAVEYVVGEVVDPLPAPIYAIFDIEKRIKEKNLNIEDRLWSAPETDSNAFQWTGEWTVTFETFRDMGLAFGVAMVFIYILVVWEFGNFIIPMVIMSPIPLTLLGIIPAHWIKGAEFTATSMIGWIALAGIIVRNSILLVDFAVHEIKAGASVRDAVLLSCKARTRPIIITALALVGGAFVILSDPIFQGMALSLMSGVLVSTALTLIVIPLGCISRSKDMLKIAGVEGRARSHEQDPDPIQQEKHGNVGGAFKLLGYIVRLPFILLGKLFFKEEVVVQEKKSQSKDNTEKAKPVDEGNGEQKEVSKKEGVIEILPEEQEKSVIAEPPIKADNKTTIAETETVQSEEKTKTSEEKTETSEEKSEAVVVPEEKTKHSEEKKIEADEVKPEEETSQVPDTQKTPKGKSGKGKGKGRRGIKLKDDE